MKTALAGFLRSAYCLTAAAACTLAPVTLRAVPAQPEQGKAVRSLRLDPSIIQAFGGTKAVTRPSRDAVMGFSLPTQVMEVVARGGQEVTTGELLLRGDDAEDMALLTLQRVRAESDLAVQGAQKRMELAKLCLLYTSPSPRD